MPNLLQIGKTRLCRGRLGCTAGSSGGRIGSLDSYARSTRLTHLTVRTPHTTFEGRHSLPRILALLAVLQEARGMGLRLSDKPFEMQYLPHKYNDVAIELPAGGHVPLDDRPEGVVGRASFHLGGARAPKRYFVL